MTFVDTLPDIIVLLCVVWSAWSVVVFILAMVLVGIRALDHRDDDYDPFDPDQAEEASYP